MPTSSIRSKMVISTGLCLLATTVVIVAYSVFAMRAEVDRSYVEAVEMAKRNGGTMADQYAKQIQTKLDVGMDAARNLAQIFAGIHDDHVELELDRDGINSILKSVLQSNPAFDAVYAYWEPDAFDGSDVKPEQAAGQNDQGRFVPRWKRIERNKIVLEIGDDYAAEDGGYARVEKSLAEIALNPRMVDGVGKSTLVVPLFAPILVKGRFQGAVGVDLRLEFLQKLADDVDLYHRSGTMTVISPNGVVCAATSKPAAVGTSLMQFAASHRTGKQAATQWLAVAMKGERRVWLDNGELAACAPIPIGRKSMPWSVEIRAPRSAITQSAETQRNQAVVAMWKMIGIGVLCASLALTYMWLDARKFTRPILECVESVVALSRQNFSRPCRVETNDEIGRMAQAINQSIVATQKAMENMQIAAQREKQALAERAEQQRLADEAEEQRRLEDADRQRRQQEKEQRRAEEETTRQRRQAEEDHLRAEELRRKVDELLAVVSAAAAGDLTKPITTTGNESINALARGIGRMLEDLSRIIGQVAESADQFSEVSYLVAQGAQSLAQGAQTQSTSVEEIAASIEELAHSIDAVRRNASEANDLAKQTNSLAQRGGAAVSRSIDGMELIRSSSQQMSEIIQVISDIAGQTNLLALNAAIEAARAGQHGMGFAVVADEVRKLAERSNQAANEIARLIRESTQRVGEGTQLSDETGEALKAIIIGVEATAAKIEEIATATIQQASNANEVAKAIQEVAAITEQTTSGTQEIASSSQQLGAQATLLHELVCHFKKHESFPNHDREEAACEAHV
ncbi:MAG: HAMP domain-containing protein [Pirellulales bacterium]|nr:HAMP domain-containing protein [Pirellulales bacterium]